LTDQQPSVGRIVHYRSYGTPGGEYSSQCRAAVIAGLPDGASLDADLVVLNPTGLFFNRCPYEHEDNGPGGKPRGGTWHWPERA
jgi:hypothetical protein